VGSEVRVSPGGVCDLEYHVAWCPKYRRPALTGLVKDKCAELIRAKVGEHGRRIVTLDVMPDHVCLSVKAHAADSPPYVANQSKGLTSRMLRQEVPHVRSRLPTLWPRSYFGATVGAAPTWATRTT
jgi:putative transposase